LKHDKTRLDDLGSQSGIKKLIISIPIRYQLAAINVEPAVLPGVHVINNNPADLPLFFQHIKDFNGKCGFQVGCIWRDASHEFPIAAEAAIQDAWASNEAERNDQPVAIICR
jgi:hypothetical protein